MAIQAMPTRGDVELPSMPGARDDVATNDTLSQGATGVRADSIHRVEAVVQMKQSHDAATGDKFTTAPERDVFDRCNAITV